MQTASGLWTWDARRLTPRPGSLHGRPGMPRGAMRRCLQCVIYPSAPVPVRTLCAQSNVAKAQVISAPAALKT